MGIFVTLKAWFNRKTCRKFGHDWGTEPAYPRESLGSVTIAHNIRLDESRFVPKGSSSLIHRKAVYQCRRCGEYDDGGYRKNLEFIFSRGAKVYEDFKV